MHELSVAEQWHQTVLAVISDGETVTDVPARSRQRRQAVLRLNLIARPVDAVVIGR